MLQKVLMHPYAGIWKFASIINSWRKKEQLLFRPACRCVPAPLFTLLPHTPLDPHIPHSLPSFLPLLLPPSLFQVCTLSAAGGDVVSLWAPGPGGLTSASAGFPQECRVFDACIVDEAAQALEPATLIPLQLLKPGGGEVWTDG